MTDDKGQFTLPEVSGNTWFFRPQLVSANPYSDQQIYIVYEDRRFLVWSLMNLDFEMDKLINFFVDLNTAELVRRTGTWVIKRTDLEIKDSK